MNEDAAAQDQPAVSRPLELVPERVLRREQQHYAIVDIGSNSVRLVVYDQLGRAPFPRFNEKSLCRLAEGLDETGELPAEGFRRTVEAVRRFRPSPTAMECRAHRRARDRGRAPGEQRRRPWSPRSRRRPGSRSAC